MPWVTGPVTFAAVIVPVMVPEVADGQAGWLPPPHRNIMTPPATFVGAKCKWAKRRVVDSPENVIEKVIVLPTSIRNVAEPAVLFGGTSLSPISLAEKSSVAAGAVVAKRPAANATLAQAQILLILMAPSCLRRIRKLATLRQ